MAEEDLISWSSDDTWTEDSSSDSEAADSIFSDDDNDLVPVVLYMANLEVRLPASPPFRFRGNIFTAVAERPERDANTFYYNEFDEEWHVLPDIFTVVGEHDEDDRGELVLSRSGCLAEIE